MTACTAYSRYILDVGQSDDWLALQIALAPCLIGYGAIAKRLYNDRSSMRDGNRYWKWIENYAADDYSKAVQIGSGMMLQESPVMPLPKADDIPALLEEHMRKVSPSRLEDLIKIFIRATELEIGFWDMGLSGEKELRRMEIHFDRTTTKDVHGNESK
jgi:thiaminase